VVSNLFATTGHQRNFLNRGSHCERVSSDLHLLNFINCRPIVASEPQAYILNSTLDFVTVIRPVSQWCLHTDCTN